MIKNQSKQEWRNWWKQTYPKDEGERKKRFRPVQELILQSELFLEAPTVAIYSALPWEVDLKPLWQKRPDACVLPKVLPESNGLEFYRIADWNDLKPGFFGILEPEVAPGFQVSHWEIGSLILVPGVAFDEKGARIGSGKGCYDRFLPLLPKGVHVWGVCLSEQYRDQSLQQESTDVRMGAVVTDIGFQRSEI